MIDFDGLYCTDENIAIEARGDYATLVSQSSLLGSGRDGVIDASNRWLLTSATNDFGSQGIPEGAVAVLTIGSAQTETPQLFGISSADSDGLLLRRLGLSDGQGQPPAPAAGATGIQFKIPTCLADIVEATRWLNQMYQIPTVATLALPTDLRSACVLHVLISLYGAAMRGKDGKDIWGTKYEAAVEQRTVLAETLTETYGPSTQARRVSAPVEMVIPSTWRPLPNW